ncbi:family 43 glycosylhydrolase [Clostridium saccharobutylicum]|uniref:family 43 glycosylhydrolase n=1 Tax=Clostridium saccharobutylicum TaxID=169679 RepID=UPI0007E02404|nr:family 43 glycosylhydrolase [Clostridium saccharobutylicum]OAV41368.1 arabinoxylan arabinofuranohydrolase XynD [Clostridium saccharobutylicum DSM 13864]
MVYKKMLIPLLSLSICLTGVSFECKDANAAVVTSNSSYESQFNSIALAKGYKDLTQGNPCMTQKFAADPGVMEYNGRVYVYSTNDHYMYDSKGAVIANSFDNVQTINCMSSDDMANWTDHGTINVAGSNGAAKWATHSWAPAAAHKTINGKERFFLYFADRGGGIGVLTSDSPTGPWKDPLGHALVNKATPNCSNITWLFDPAVFIDDDGSAYLSFGGGVPNGQAAHPKTSRVVKLGADMISLAGTPTTIDAPYILEDSGLNKDGNTYYYTYCTNWESRSNSSDPGVAEIAYMTSNSPTGPFTYKGTILKNPGKYFGCYGNNHHSIVKFKNKWYIFYHSQWLENKMGTNKGYRSAQVDEINISNGKISPATGTLTGVAQTKDLNPYTLNQMSTMAWQGGIKGQGLGNTDVQMSAGNWVGVSNVGFGTGPASITMKVSSQKGSVIKVCTDNPSNKALGYVVVPPTGNAFTNVSANVSNITGTKKLFFVSSNDCVVDNWQFSKNPASGTGSSTTKDSTNTSGTTQTLSDGWYYIKNVNAQKYLQVANNVGKAAQNVELGTGSGAAGQKWYLKNVGNGYVTLKSALGNYMLDVYNGENKDGSNIRIFNAYSNNAQKFALKSSSTNGAYGITTMSSNQTKALDDYNFQTFDGANVCQWTYGGTNNQLWIFEAAK